jgi:shikimate dehydrogenase
MEITGKTRLLGVIGDPIEHSLSPKMHNAAIEHLGLDYVYLPFRIQLEDLGAALAGFRAIDLQGFNVTIPHKQAIIPLLTEISTTAHLVGAVNTVYKTPQGWAGTNTDVQGFITPLKVRGGWQGTQVLVLGYGGAARAVVVGCQQLGCKQIQVVGRNPEKLKKFHQSWAGSPLEGLVTVHPWEDLATLSPHADLVVNTTPIGMAPEVQASPLELLGSSNLPSGISPSIASLKPGSIAYDLIYNPAKTLFLQQAEQQQAIILNGLEMLVHQGAAALEIWLDHTAPIAIMQQSLSI